MTNSRTALLLSFLDSAEHLNVAELASVVSEMCVNQQQPLTHNEAVIAYDILERLYPDAEQMIRRRLSEQFALRDDVPRSLILLLANDAIEIARPIIMHNPALDDNDLIKIIVERTREHRVAVSVRQSVSPKVCDVLVYLGDDDIILNLARNPGARFSEHAFKRLVTASRNNPQLHQPVLSRPEMRPELAALMYQWVGMALKKFIAQNYGASLSLRLDDEIRKAGHEAAQEEGLRQSALAPTKRKEVPVPSHFMPMVVAMRNGDLKTVEVEMAALTHLPHTAVQRILYHDKGEALAVVCRANGADRALFSEMVARLQSRPPYSTFMGSADYAASLQAFQRLSQRQAEFVLDHWRAKPNSVWGTPDHVNEAWKMRHQTSV